VRANETGARARGTGGRARRAAGGSDNRPRDWGGAPQSARGSAAARRWAPDRGGSRDAQRTPVDSRRGRGVVIPKGGGSLDGSMGPFAVATFKGNDTQSIQVGQPPAPGQPAPMVTLEVHDPSKPDGDVLEITGGSRGPQSAEAFPTGGGYIVIVSLLNNPQAQSGAPEAVFAASTSIHSSMLCCPAPRPVPWPAT